MSEITTAEMVKALRCISRDAKMERTYGDGTNTKRSVLIEVADRLEALEREIAELKTETEHCTETCVYANGEHHAIDALTAKIKRLERKLAAAKADLALTADCGTCYMRGRKGFSACKPDADMKCWQWRGEGGHR